ncbi:hypothetical protein KCU81_g459, partial [Aureobasidium melanogenum]
MLFGLDLKYCQSLRLRERGQISRQIAVYDRFLLGTKVDSFDLRVDVSILSSPAKFDEESDQILWLQTFLVQRACRLRFRWNSDLTCTVGYFSSTGFRSKLLEDYAVGLAQSLDDQSRSEDEKWFARSSR